MIKKEVNKMELIEPAPGAKNISFDRNEWKNFLDEIDMRKGKEISKCVNNARYLAMLDRAEEQFARGDVIRFTLEELRAL